MDAAVLVPAKTVAAEIQKLGAELRSVASAPEISALPTERGLETMMTTPEQATAHYKAEFKLVES